MVDHFAGMRAAAKAHSRDAAGESRFPMTATTKPESGKIFRSELVGVEAASASYSGGRERLTRPSPRISFARSPSASAPEGGEPQIPARIKNGVPRTDT
jgi:hypothetical protein